LSLATPKSSVTAKEKSIVKIEKLQGGAKVDEDRGRGNFP
jgi:hypothetical protein